jgi:hypothetical protein
VSHSWSAVSRFTIRRGSGHPKIRASRRQATLALPEDKVHQIIGRRAVVARLESVGALQRTAYDFTLAPDDQMRRIRDEFLSYDHPEVEE